MDTMMSNLLNTTKTALCSNVQEEVNKANFFNFFTKLLEDCSLCVSQSLDSAVDLLCENNFNTNRLIEYIEDTVCLLRLMCNYIKNVVELISLYCCTLTSFPITTAQILVTVFKHCKESEHIYGGNLVKVGKQLKDLFRTCHELQLTYLMVMEKHFLFDVSKKDEQQILLKALQINLEIGEIVQGLDVKTLAEQWKAYTTMCEKHVTYLMDTNVYSECTQILCSMIKSNIKNSLEVGLDEKVVIRSLKVTTFVIKILLKVTNIFRNVTINKHDDVVETLIDIYLNNEAYLTLQQRSPQLINMFQANVLSPTNLLLSELLQNESFANCLHLYDVADIRKDDKLLGFIILMTTVMKHILRDEEKSKVSSQNLLRCVLDCVPYCHIWFSMPLKFDGESLNSEASYGLYEHLLTHTAAVSLTLDYEEMCALENIMCESLLATDCWRGLFASNLWVLVARMSCQPFILSQLVYLCGMYQKLESHCLFANSPQHIYLSSTITRLFELLDKDHKTKLLRHFSPLCDEANISLWIALRVNNVPWEYKTKFEEEVIEECKLAIDKFCSSNANSSDIRSLIKIINLLATFSITSDKMDEYVIKAWIKVCLKNNISISKGDFDKSTIWFLEYVQAITELTNSLKNKLFANPTNLMKILHVMLTLIQNGNTELRLYLIEPVCKYAILHKPESKNAVESLVSDAFLILFQSDVIVKGKLLIKLNKYKRDVKMDKIISLTVNQDNIFRKSWNSFKEKLQAPIERHVKNEQLEMTMEYHYSHRCLDKESELISFKKDLDFNNSNLVQLERKSSENFDFVDVEEIFEHDSESEPSRKKIKYNNDANDIVCRLENDTMLLYKIKENVFDADTKRRLKTICEKLKNIVE